MQPPDLSILVPVFNEEPDNLVLLLERLKSVLQPMLVFYEVVFVDDGSRAVTRNALRELAQQNTNLKVVTLSRNFGEQAAICAGYEHVSGSVVINMDSDLQDPPELIPSMLQYWREGYDIVYTKQADRKESWLRQMQAKTFYFLLNLVSYITIPRDAGEFRLLSRRAVDALRALPESQRFLRGLVPWIGFKSIVLPFNRDARKNGTSGYTMKKLIGLAVQGLMSFSIIPLLITPILTIVLAFIALGLTCANEFVHWFVVSPSLILASILAVTLLLALCFSCLGVGLMQILSEVKRRPTFIVEDVYQSSVSSAVQREAIAQTAKEPG